MRFEMGRRWLIGINFIISFMRKTLLTSVVIILLGVAVLFAFLLLRDGAEDSSVAEPERDAEEERLDGLTFSNTMQWDPEFLALANSDTSRIKNWRLVFDLPPPPANSSAETERELRLLFSYKELRTAEKIQQIEKEIFLGSFEMGGLFVADYLDFSKYPDTALLLRTAFSDLNVIIMSMKKRFDRVRPSVLRPDIEPVIEVPHHPAYPSGHSTQSHFLAFLLADIIPEKKRQLLLDADSISKNREIAGLHYPSDTEAGRLLARQFADFLLRSPDFVELLENARKEWE
jgi:acid phosphatase (class A)